MLQAFGNILKIPDLRKKILFTLAIIAVYRIGAFVPTPGIDGTALARFFQQHMAGGTLLGFMGMFTGGALQKATIFALGIMPYISASIILQLLTVVLPALEKLAICEHRNGCRARLLILARDANRIEIGLDDTC